MIPLQKALSWTKVKQTKSMIRDIYKSRGECRDCIFIGDRGVYCGKHSMYVPSNGFCWKFEADTEEEIT